MVDVYHCLFTMFVSLSCLSLQLPFIMFTHGRKSSCNVISEHPNLVKEKGRRIDCRHAPSGIYRRHTLLSFADTINFIIITVTKFFDLIGYWQA